MLPSIISPKSENILNMYEISGSKCRTSFITSFAFVFRNQNINAVIYATKIDRSYENSEVKGWLSYYVGICCLHDLL